MNYTFAQYQESADYIRSQIGGFAPKVAMILGSGLGYMGDIVENPIAVPYQNIPHFKVSTAPGHKGQLVFGTLEGQKVAVMQGRMHHYEGYSYEEVSYAVRVLRLLGCDTLIVTNAAGCVNLDWKAGDLMLIADHIKFFMESPCGVRTCPSSACASPTPPTSTPPPCGRWPARPPGSWASGCGRASTCTSPAPSTNSGGGAGRPGAGRRRSGHVHRAGGHHRRPLWHAGAGLYPPVQHGRRYSGPAPLRAGGAGCGGGLPGQVLPPRAGLPEKD